MENGNITRAEWREAVVGVFFLDWKRCFFVAETVDVGLHACVFVYTYFAQTDVCLCVCVFTHTGGRVVGAATAECDDDIFGHALVSVVVVFFFLFDVQPILGNVLFCFVFALVGVMPG